MQITLDQRYETFPHQPHLFGEGDKSYRENIADLGIEQNYSTEMWKWGHEHLFNIYNEVIWIHHNVMGFSV